ncbi:MAG: nitroreductase family protein [Spirochaeta sp.]|nr:nitroreductase family protein [Spirochaeta sp.]
MDFLKLVQHRRSVRAYREDPVPPDLLTSCLEAARLAPSATNSQPWHFIVVTDTEVRSRIAELTRLPGSRMNAFAAQAPVIIAVVAEPPRLVTQIGALLQKTPFYLLDIGIAAEHLCLRAAEAGLGTCMIGWFDEKKVASLLGIPKGSGLHRRRVSLLITLGYPADAPREAKRKPLQSIVSYERYGGEGN